MSALVPWLLAACLAVTPGSDHVTAGDLAPQFPGLEAVDGDTPLGLAPPPAAVRVFRGPELAQIAKRFDVPSPDHEICVTRPVTRPEPEVLLDAMRRELPSTPIELLDFSRVPIPAGEIRFPANGLRQGAANALWSGYVLYGGGRRFSIWARVKLHFAVARGDTVRVAVRNGAAHLELDAKAEAAGVPGSLIPVRNLISNRRFRARVEGEGKVSVDLTAQKLTP